MLSSCGAVSGDSLRRSVIRPIRPVVESSKRGRSVSCEMKRGGGSRRIILYRLECATLEKGLLRDRLRNLCGAVPEAGEIARGGGRYCRWGARGSTLALKPMTTAWASIVTTLQVAWPLPVAKLKYRWILTSRPKFL